MNKPQIKVVFVDIEPRDNFIINILKKEYEIIIDKKNPDFIFFSNFGNEHLKYKNCVKIFTTIESLIPDFTDCDYAISSRRIIFENRHFYCPPALAYNGGDAPISPVTSNFPTNRKFCSFLYSSIHTKGSIMRRDFCLYLMKHYKHVDCPGEILHNIDIPSLQESRHIPQEWRKTKINFLSEYKFNIAFENTDIDGYITEKLMDCFLAGTVPIYYGSSKNLSPFPKAAIIHANDYPDFESLVARIKEVDENDELYLSILQANPLLHGMKINDDNGILRFLHPVLTKESSISPESGLYSDSCTNTAKLTIFVKQKWLIRFLCYIPAATLWCIYKLAGLVTTGEYKQRCTEKRQDYGKLLYLLKKNV